MDRVTSAARGCLAAFGGILLGLLVVLVAAVPSADPVHAAQQPPVTGDCAWDPSAGEWVIDWTITPVLPDGATGYQVTGIAADPATQVDGFSGQVDGFTGQADEDPALTGEQRLPAEATAGWVTVSAQWTGPAGDGLGRTRWHGELTIPDDCATLGASDLLTDFTYDCETLTITINNPTDERVGLTFAAAGGDPFQVDVAGRESANVRFPASAGQSVDVLLDGRSIVDPADPIEITPSQWREQDCQAADDAAAAGLAATGSRIALIVGGAVALLGAGVGLYLLARRHRVRFTA